MRANATAYAAARDRFESWARIDAPNLPADPIDAMQVRLARWQAANFTATGDELVTLGIGEECSELAQADGLADILDALGDVCIYAAQLCTSNRLAIGPILEDCDGELVVDLIVPVGALNHLVLKRAQRIREGLLPLEEYRAKLFAAIRYVVRAATAEAEQWLDDGESARTAFLATAERVLARNWIAHPATGAAAAPGDQPTVTAPSATTTIAPELVERFAAYYRTHPMWGVLHVSFADGNWWCAMSPSLRGDATEEEHALCELHDSLSESQRRRLRDQAERAAAGGAP